VNALIRLTNILIKYPFLENGDFPEIIPEELRVPFSQFVATHQLEPLATVYFRTFLENYYPKSLDQHTTLGALLSLSRYALALTSTPNLGMTAVGGCNALYNGIERYIGSQNIRKRIKITQIKRNGYNDYEQGVTIRYTSHHKNKKVFLF
jgi:hypothetical protein